LGENKKEWKALKALFGEDISETELKKQLELYNGNAHLLIQKMVEQNIKSENIDKAQVDPLYAQQIEQINAILDKKQKSDRICWYACGYAKQKKEELFVDLIEQYHSKQEILWDREFEFCEKKASIVDAFGTSIDSQ